MLLYYCPIHTALYAPFRDSNTFETTNVRIYRPLLLRCSSVVARLYIKGDSTARFLLHTLRVASLNLLILQGFFTFNGKSAPVQYSILKFLSYKIITKKKKIKKL